MERWETHITIGTEGSKDKKEEAGGGKRGEKAEVVSREGGGAPGPAPARSHE